jgi:hypothetical protein
MTAVGLVLSAAVIGFSANAAEKVAQPAKQVEFFEAIKAGDIAVKLIPKDAKEANVIIENKAKQPLEIKLPDAFAGVPVLAQFGGMGGMGGGGMGGMGGGGMGGMGMGGGFFSVGPDKVGKIKVTTVCLEHGKQDPNPRIPYEIRPIETFTQDQRVIEVCKMLGRGELAQNVAQAAAWHLGNGLTWDELAAKDRVKLSNGYTEKFFSAQELTVAARVSQEAVRRAGDKKPESPGEYGSLSRN